MNTTRIRGVIAAAVAMACVATGALAQGWTWPWDAPKRVEPRQPIPRPPAGLAPPPGFAPPPFAAQSNVCLQLEQRLAQEANRGTTLRDELPRLESEMRQLDRQYQSGQAQLERQDCYDYFLFSKTLRRTRACLTLANEVEDARRRLTELEARRQQLAGGNQRALQDDIIRELARNNCGPAYQQEARRRDTNPFSSLWQDEDSGSGFGQTFQGLPFATYRTVCVRLCDGYYFPVSFSTLPTHFDRDADVCQQKCAAPSELFYHQNPGGSVEQMVSFKSRQPYTSLKTAFRYRKEFLAGCSCKQTEANALTQPLPEAEPADAKSKLSPLR